MQGCAHLSFTVILIMIQKSRKITYSLNPTNTTYTYSWNLSWILVYWSCLTLHTFKCHIVIVITIAIIMLGSRIVICQNSHNCSGLNRVNLICPGIKLLREVSNTQWNYPPQGSGNTAGSCWVTLKETLKTQQKLINRLENIVLHSRWLIWLHCSCISRRKWYSKTLSYSNLVYSWLKVYWVTSCFHAVLVSCTSHPVDHACSYM